MREAVKQKVHCSGSIRFLREKAALRNLGGLGVWLAGPGRRSPGWERYSSGAGHHPPELHLPTEDGVGPTAGVQSQEVSIPAEAEQGRGRRGMRRAGLPGTSVSAPLFPTTHLVWKISVKSCSRKSTREVSLQISFTYTCTTTESGPFSYESFLTNARFTMDSGSTLRPQISATQDRFPPVTILLSTHPPTL